MKVVVLIALAACGKDAAPVATLLEGQGSVEREHGGKMAAAPNGQPYFVGDAARTGSGTWARLRLRDQAVLRLGEDTVVRFAAGGARLEVGEAQAENAAVTITTEAGEAQIEAGGVLRASGGAGGVRYQVDIGRAVIQREDGPLTLERGAGIVVSVGGAIVERIGGAEPAAAGAIDAGVPETATDAAAATADTIAVTITGRGVTQKRGAEPAGPLPAGEARIAPGVVIKLPAGAGATVARGNDTAAIRGPAEITLGAAGEPIASARTGEARLSARDGDLAMRVPGGTIIMRKGGDADLAIGRRETVVRVERGDAALDGDQRDADARAGETGVLTKDGEASVRDLVPSTIDLALPIGESAVVHDASRKVAVRVDFTELCAGGGVLELADRGGSFRKPRRIGGQGAAFFALAGTTRYRVRCDGGGVVKHGSVRVAGDTGAAPVVRTAATNAIETDGRKYTVTYQNRIPALAVSWNEATGASTLHVAAAGGAERTFDATGAHRLASGTLDEGSYTLWITAGTRSSPRTTLRIAFDNAAPTAQITAPAPRSPWADTLAITGVTVEGWSVAVDGKPAPRDHAGRFRAEVDAAGKSTIAVRLAHPQHGVHYYLRRRK